MQNQYRVLCNGALIGTSALESRDPGMGTATGRFVPTEAYRRVRPIFLLFAQAQRDTGSPDQRLLDEYYRSRDALALSVFAETGVAVPTTLVHIADFMDDVDETACEIEVHISDADFFAQAAAGGR